MPGTPELRGSWLPWRGGGRLPEMLRGRGPRAIDGAPLLVGVGVGGMLLFPHTVLPPAPHIMPAGRVAQFLLPSVTIPFALLLLLP